MHRPRREPSHETPSAERGGPDRSARRELGAWVPPGGSVVLRSARRVDPDWAAPRVALAHALLALLVVLALFAWPGERTYPASVPDSARAFREALVAPYRVGLAFVAMMGLGAAKRCFGAPGTAWAAWGLGLAGAGLAAAVAPARPSFAMLAAAALGGALLVLASAGLAPSLQPGSSRAAGTFAAAGALLAFAWRWLVGAAAPPVTADATLAAGTLATGGLAAGASVALALRLRWPRGPRRSSARPRSP